METDESPKKLSEMVVGEICYCAGQAYYVGPNRPKWFGFHLTQSTTEAFLLDCPVRETRSQDAPVRVRRDPEGYVLWVPKGWAPKFDRNEPLDEPLPVVWINSR